MFNRAMRQLPYNGWENASYGLYDTLVCSFSRYGEFNHLMRQKPVDQRSRVIGSMSVSHNEVFYCDEYGAVSKWQLEGDS